MRKIILSSVGLFLIVSVASSQPGGIKRTELDSLMVYLGDECYVSGSARLQRGPAIDSLTNVTKQDLKIALSYGPPCVSVPNRSEFIFLGVAIAFAEYISQRSPAWSDIIENLIVCDVKDTTNTAYKIKIYDCLAALEVKDELHPVISVQYGIPRETQMLDNTPKRNYLKGKYELVKNVK